MFAGVSVAATYTPINICDNYSAVNSTIQHLDWRSVWSGNSRIREGLTNLARLIRSFPPISSSRLLNRWRGGTKTSYI